eukprot:CAMPEP_0197186504 /NCGR_PEP_ID=MMETSP1423-20130617/14081_1 /TAXON_ID=476441 /ORGANISM="Pseudo-nitzschia heimii, Strain UNC1101" /LENGTH=450 /DNA_ID=CAMNT_0042637849 /DNA_START=213 /DNA_END=1565 /DNA_ORIENTATION=-
MKFQLVVLILATSGANAFLMPTTKSRSSVKMFAGSQSSDQDGKDANSDGLVPSGFSLQSQLASAFSNLDESDQYDAVLTGLCAKILDEPSMSGDDVIVALEDPISLLEEMNARRVSAGNRSLMALVDAAAAAKDSKTMSKVISLSSRNGSISQYGLLQRDVTLLPATINSKVACPDGTTKTRGERLATLPDVPTDERGTEISSALAVSSVLGFCWVAGVLNIEEITPFTTLLWTFIVAIGTLDNFYDLIKLGVKTFANDLGGKLPKELPLSLGSGQLTGTVVKGFNRLIQVDTERECECEAAAFYIAYSLGLPCFSFRPNALEAAVMVAESSQSDNDLDPLLTNNGMMKVLVWLMAPVAMESVKHPQLIQSDPREADGFLSRLEKSNLIKKEDLWWLDEDPQEKEDMLKWAYAEADVLLRRQSTVVTEITERLASGAATVGDCVAAIENY